MNNDSPLPTSASASSSKEPEPTAKPETDDQKAHRAEKVKAQGNTSFKAKRYGEAIDLYTKAIGSSLDSSLKS